MTRRRVVLLVILSLALVACGSSGPAAGEHNPRATVTPEKNAGSSQRGPLWSDETISCVQKYSPTAAVGHTFAFDGTVTAIAAGRTNRPDKGHLDLAAVTFNVHEWFAGTGGGSVTVDMPEPDSQSAADVPAYEVGSRLLVSGEPRWGGDALDDAIAWSCGFSRHYDAGTAAAWRTA